MGNLKPLHWYFSFLPVWSPAQPHSSDNLQAYLLPSLFYYRHKLPIGLEVFCPLAICHICYSPKRTLDSIARLGISKWFPIYLETIRKKSHGNLPSRLTIIDVIPKLSGWLTNRGGLNLSFPFLFIGQDFEISEVYFQDIELKFFIIWWLCKVYSLELISEHSIHSSHTSFRVTFAGFVSSLWALMIFN